MMPLAAIDNAALMFIIAMAGVTTFLMLRAQKRLGRRPKDTLPSARQKPARRVPTYDVHSPVEVERWEVRMHELTRELSATLDTKASALQYLLEQADAKIARLEALADAQPAPRPARGATPSIATDARYQRVYALADAGQNHQSIAAAIGAPVGEVQLILGLRQPS